MANRKLINLEGLSKVIERTKASNYRPATTKINKYINYYINNKKVLINYRLANYKPVNLSISREN